MESFPKLTASDSLGGLYEFFFVDVKDVISIPRPVGQVIQGDILLKPGAQWGRGVAAAETARFQEPDGLDVHGIFYHPKLSGFYPRDGVVVANLFAQLKRGRYLILYRPNLGEDLKLAGTLIYPLRFNYELDTSNKVAGTYGYNFQFAERTTSPSYKYTGSFSVADEGTYEGGSGGDTGPCPGLTQLVGTHTDEEVSSSVIVNGKTIGVTSGLVVQLTAAQLKTILTDTNVLCPLIGQISNGELQGCGVIFPTLQQRIAENNAVAIRTAIDLEDKEYVVAEELAGILSTTQLYNLLKAKGKLQGVIEQLTFQEGEDYIPYEHRKYLTEIPGTPPVFLQANRAPVTGYATYDEIYFANNVAPAQRNFGERFDNSVELHLNSRRFGHKYRFCGLTGGYYDKFAFGSQWFTQNGVATTKALALPGNILLDLGTGYMWYIIPFSGVTWADAVYNATTFSTVVNGVTYNGWRLPNDDEAKSVFGEKGSGSTFQLEPFNFTPDGGRIWTSSSRSLSAGRSIHPENQVNNQTKSTLYGYVVCRRL